MTTQQAGQEGFVWFIGRVEEVDSDPLHLGRVRVRPLNENTEGVETEDLRWASILVPPTSASINGIGVSPTGILVGSTVFGFYIDGREKQKPAILGTLHTIPGLDDAKHGVSQLARGENSIEKSPIGPEPASAYHAEYPYNKTLTTLSGHAIEVDDTPGHERIHIYHKSGTYDEINEDGRRVSKTVDDNYSVTVGDGKVYVQGDVDVEILGNCTVNVAKTVTVTGAEVNIIAAGLVNISGSRINLN